jgi:phosphoglycerate dehydrogenase-like enzyme
LAKLYGDFDALNSGIAGAAVDVHSTKPTPCDPISSTKKDIVTAPIAWATKEAQARLLDTEIANVCTFLYGNPVNVGGRNRCACFPTVSRIGLGTWAIGGWM